MILLASSCKKYLKAERYYDTKADACMRLSEIAQKKRGYGNIHSSGKKADNVSGQCTN
mgnify:CR=1 FL=1